jgi:flavin reductase (DIM6/NTAB) family NADH-FMN oxidoreductase RutF
MSNDLNKLIEGVEVSPPPEVRQALRGVASTVHAVAAKMPSGAFFATTATAVVPVCLEPPTLAVCLNSTSAMVAHLSICALFSVSALACSQVDVARACAGGLPHEEREQFFTPSRIPGASLVEGAQAAFVCRCTNIVPVGTHAMIFGNILDVTKHPNVEPLIYLNAQYGSFEARPEIAG